MDKRLITGVALLLIITPAIYLLIIYQSLPDSVPVHFGLDGKPDRFGNKSELILSTAILSVLNLGIYLLLTNIHKIGPKKSAGQSKSAMQKIAFAIVILMSGICFMVIQSAQHGNILFDKVFVPAMGLFFAWLGYLMNDIKPNYFVGIRTPWTLESEDTWKETHKMASNNGLRVGY